jgi:hypothetical protein
MRRLLTWTTLASITLAITGCTTSSSVGGEGGGGNTNSTGTGTLPPQPQVDKVDIVLGIDNSRSMADKQEILSLALADLVQSLTNPACVDQNKQPVNQPASPTDPCPAGSTRSFAPINDIHIGIVTTSLGGHGSDACPNTGYPGDCPGGTMNTSTNDMGHLITRTDVCSTTKVPTYQNNGFLAWDPTGTANNPPGETNVTNLTQGIKDLVLGAGQVGCGYESQLESWYRFLADPDPYQSLQLGPDKAVTAMGVDNVLLAERAAFLRPDSLLAILMLSDENDCSIKEYGQFYLAAQQRSPADPNKNFYLPRARQECATNPNDPCCASCGQVTPAGCPADPTCAGTPQLDAKTDDVDLRCWDQKRRFGIDFLYPIDRYVNALTQKLVVNRQGEMVQNPIFSNLGPNPNAQVRDAGLVVLAGIVGVPWQDLARNPADLNAGYKSAEELAHANGGVTTWDVILGDPATYKPPLDPHMIESPFPRTGQNPLTGDTLAPPSMTEGGSDPINGHEYTTGTQNGVQVAPDDLEYACTFPLQTPRDCSDPAVQACDCLDPLNDNPLCAPDPTKNGARTLQVRAKAYPGLRQLNLIRDLGPQGVAASICPAQQDDPSRADYAYRPAIRALIERVGARLKLQ